MKLVKFSVTNYRSITDAHRISLSETTILIGKNNEGKSNVLKALQLAMKSLEIHASQARRGTVGFVRKPDRYDWNRDFPIALQNRKSGTQTILRLEFLLDEGEIAEFKKIIGSNLNGTLPIVIRFGKDSLPKITVAKQGRGAKTLNKKSGRIANFVAQRITFNYIPAIRTDRQALDVIGVMLSQELGVLEDDEAYRDALDTISTLQRPILDALAARIKDPLTEFLPNINDVKIEILERKRRVALRKDFKVIIDDGTPTDIEFKGDGVKSLAALSLLKDRHIKTGASIIAIEEPESHLHPGAIHQLNEIISALAEENQLLISTHNPLFVDRQKIRSNIVINEGTAVPAKSIGVIRDLLGIRASDNLVNASYVLVVEGEENRVSLAKLLPYLSKKISRALRDKLLVIEAIGGAGNLSYKLSLLRNALCVTHVLLDNDAAGKMAMEKAREQGLLRLSRCTLTICPGMGESEFEDCIDVELYREKVLDEFGVRLGSRSFRSNSKWSDRASATFQEQGKPWSDSVQAELKALVGNCVAEMPERALNEHKRSSIDALVTALEGVISGNGEIVLTCGSIAPAQTPVE